MVNRLRRGAALTLALACLAAGPTSGPTSGPAFDPAAAAAHGTAALDLTQQRLTLPDGRGLYAQEIHPADAAFQADAGRLLVGRRAADGPHGRRPARPRPVPGRRPSVRRRPRTTSTGPTPTASAGTTTAPTPSRPTGTTTTTPGSPWAWSRRTRSRTSSGTWTGPADTLRYVLSGEDDKLGGGLYWQERTKASKNTCGNAPGIAAAVRVYTYTHDRAQLDTAVRLYRWTVKNLRDDRDGLYYDNLTLGGKLSPHKFTYNTALMIRSGCLLYDATGDAAYLHDAQRSAASSVARWVDPAPARSPTRPTSPTCWPSRCWNCRPATTTRGGRPPTTPPWPTSGRPSGTRPGSSPNGGTGRSAAGAGGPADQPGQRRPRSCSGPPGPSRPAR